jgi:CheY-like chemotaxis protein
VPRIVPQAADSNEIDALWELEPGRIPILAVEDNDADAFAFARALAGTRYQVLPARTVAQAKRALDRVSPAAICLDVMLAGEETWRFLIELKQRELTQSIPVIVASTTQEERKARSLGADEYLSKPIDPKRLIQALDAATGRHSVTQVLVIDDEEISRYLVRQLLPRGAYALGEAASGLEALRAIQENRPDVVLVDLNLPGMDGFDLLRRLSASEATSALPAVVLTSMHLSHAQRQQLGDAAQIVEKSNLTADTLVAAIRTAIGLRESRPA